MTLPLTPDAIRGAYDFLRSTRPFDRWGLPDAEAILFDVCNLKWKRGYFQSFRGGRRHKLSVSKACVGSPLGLLMVVGHEMVHLKQRIDGKDWVTHGPVFKRYANQICRYHGFDIKEFM